MTKVFWDTNICIDFLTNRDPWREYAADMYDKACDSKLDLCCSILSLATTSYYMEKHFSPSEIIDSLTDFIEVM